MPESRQTSGGRVATPNVPGPKVEWVKSGDKPLVIYVNMAQSHASLTDFSLDLGQVIEAREDLLIADHMLRVLMSPQHAKSLAGLLMQQINMYENAFGPIPPGSNDAALNLAKLLSTLNQPEDKR